MSDLPKGWASKRLDEVAKITMGQSPPGSSYNSSGQGVPFFQGKAEFGIQHPTVKKWTTAGTKFADAGDILMSVRAPVGPTNIANIDCAIGRGLAAIKADSNQIMQPYLLLFLKHIQSSIESRGKGSTFDAISGIELRETLLNLPSLEVQHRIVKTLEDHLSRIEKAEQELNVAHRESDSLLRSWLHAAFHPRLRNGEVAILGDLAQTRLGKMLDAAKNQGELTSYLRNANVQWERFDLGDVSRARMTEKDRSELMLADGDVLVCEGGVPGRSAVWESKFFAAESISFQKALHRVRVGEKLLPKFVVMALRYLSATDQLDEFTTGTTIKHLPQEQLRRLPIPSFSIKEQSYLIFQYEHLQELIAHATTTVEQLRNQLSELRRSLLHAAFNGQLTDTRTK